MGEVAKVEVVVAEGTVGVDWEAGWGEGVGWEAGSGEGALAGGTAVADWEGGSVEVALAGGTAVADWEAGWGEGALAAGTEAADWEAGWGEGALAAGTGAANWGEETQEVGWEGVGCAVWEVGMGLEEGDWRQFGWEVAGGKGEGWGWWMVEWELIVEKAG
ncbi:hypothetical protein ACKKBF_B40290 [Auxenochlorella protothecoides x Auxenochlorella symbiontica]